MRTGNASLVNNPVIDGVRSIPRPRPTNTYAMTKTQTITSWILQLIAAAILFQTLFFKFTGAEESRYIFTRLGIEPWGRIGSGVAELIAVVLLLIPKTSSIGA